MCKMKVPLRVRAQRNSFGRAKTSPRTDFDLIPPYMRARLSAYGGEVTIRSKNSFGYSRRTSAQSPNRISHFVSATLDSLCAESLNASELFQNSELVADRGTFPNGRREHHREPPPSRGAIVRFSRDHHRSRGPRQRYPSRG